MEYLIAVIAVLEEITVLINIKNPLISSPEYLKDVSVPISIR